MSMTVNGETYCEIAEDMMDKLIATEKRGLVVIRNKKWKFSRIKKNLVDL